MRAGWTTKPLGELCEVLDRYRKPITKSDRREGSYPYYGAMGVVDYVDGFLFDEPLILLGEDGAKWGAGDLCAFKADGKYWVNNHAHIVRPDRSQVFDDWLVYYLCGTDLLPFVTGLTVPKLNQERMRQIPIPVPPLEEQRRIVAVLNEAFAAIATAITNAEKNLANARDLFTSYLSSEIDRVWQSCPLGTLADLATEITDGDHLPPPKSKTGVPFITIGCVDKDTHKIDFTKSYAVSRNYFEKIKQNRKPKKGDVLYTVTGSYGIPVLIDFDTEFCFQRHIGLVRPKADVSSSWIRYLLLSPQILKQAHNLATGTAQKTVALKALRSFVVPRVPVQRQDEIVTMLDRVSEKTDSLIESYRQRLNLLVLFKKSLSALAFSGILAANKYEPIAKFLTPEFAAQIIAFSYVCHEKRHRQKTFGHVKAQKALHLVESIGRIELGRRPIKDAAGPNDFQHMLRATDWAVQHRFFEFVPRAGGNGYDFIKLANFGAMMTDALAATRPVSSELERAIDPIVPMVSQDAEVFATVHAAWNNLIHDGKLVSDDAIVKEARDDWHSAKLKIPEAKFRAAIKSIRAKGLVPDGTAKYVGGQGGLF